MKKFLTIITVFVYFAVSCGLVVNMHYCMGELAEISYHATEKTDDCGYCGMEDSDCCHDDLKVVKLDDTHKASTAHLDVPNFTAILTATRSFQELFPEIPEHYNLEYAKDPPDYNKPSYSILHSVFRI